MKTVIATLAIACAGAFAASAAFAADSAAAAAPAASGAVMDACHDDFQKLCPDAQPGGGQLKTCIKDHKRELSRECKKAIVQARRARKGGAE